MKKENQYPRYLDRTTRQAFVMVYNDGDEVVIRRPDDTKSNKVMKIKDFEANYVKEL